MPAVWQGRKYCQLTISLSYKTMTHNTSNLGCVYEKHPVLS